MQFHIFLLAFFLAAVFVNGSFFSDIVLGLLNSGQYINIFSQFPQSLISTLETDESEAAIFVCELAKGDIPGAIGELGEAVVNEITQDIDALTSFVKALPTLVPEVLSEIEQGGEDAVSIIEELVTDRGGAITVIESGVKSVWTDVTNGVKSFFACDLHIGNCPSRTFTSSCAQILASASATQTTPATQYAPTTSSYGRPQATATRTLYPVATTTVNEADQSSYATQDAPTTTDVPGSAEVFSSRPTLVLSGLAILAIGIVVML